MRAKFTHDLMTNKAQITVSTCSESINYMPEIYHFIKQHGFEAKMTTDFYRVRFTLTDFDGAHLASKIPQVMDFINKVQGGKYKP